MNIKKTTAFIAGGLVVLTTASFALPRHVSVERTAKIDATPGEVIALAASNEGYQTFNPYSKLDPDLQIDLYGPIAGVGSGFHFDGKDGTGSQTVADVSADKVTYAINLGALGQPVQSISAISAASGTQVTWRMDADMGFNPLFRVLGLFMDGMMGPTFELGLENLADVTA